MGQSTLVLDTEIADFKPLAFIDVPTDSLTFLNEDCSVTEEQEPKSPLVIIRSNATGKIVGVRIEGISQLLE